MENSNPSSFQERSKQFFEGQRDLISKHEISFEPVVNFPGRKKLPFLSKVAMKILKFQGARPDIRYFDIKK